MKGKKKKTRALTFNLTYVLWWERKEYGKEKRGTSRTARRAGLGEGGEKRSCTFPPQQRKGKRNLGPGGPSAERGRKGGEYVISIPKKKNKTPGLAPEEKEKETNATVSRQNSRKGGERKHFPALLPPAPYPQTTERRKKKRRNVLREKKRKKGGVLSFTVSIPLSLARGPRPQKKRKKGESRVWSGLLKYRKKRNEKDE